MATHQAHTNELRQASRLWAAGDRVLLSGLVYTARDAAHKRIASLLRSKRQPPFPMQGATIYYAGPTPTPPGFEIGSCGPTTSGRMDKYTPHLYDLGLAATIGKGKRSAEVIEAIQRNQGIYLCAIGGAGALAAKCVVSVCEVAFTDLGCESIKALTVENFPLIVGIDSRGNHILS